MKTNPFYKNNKNRNMDPKEKENINEEELMSEATRMKPRKMKKFKRRTYRTVQLRQKRKSLLRNWKKQTK